MLLVAVVGSGLHHESSEISSALAISGSLIGLSLAFGAVSGGHFNPTITLLQWLSGRRKLDCTVWYLAAQVAGGLAGALVACAIFKTAPGPPGDGLPDMAALASEGVASFGLMTIVFCCTRSTSKLVGPFAVGLWLMAAILSTPTGSIANPAVAIALLATPDSASVSATPLFVIVEIVGGALAALTVSTVYPDGG
ncbi:glycerol uptake facilitator-like aquaporin [Rhizobium esperanzae]|uniref:Glycerol uptake facilitator-like aquaporin n=2 Tax=Rhizobium/Agrobacterium group TaxID=227290 RepID=A0A7W6UPA1_9HYPH|nr:glycerol uptake facilitator-like aquaporin [Rhizobium esperanzae]